MNEKDRKVFDQALQKLRDSNIDKNEKARFGATDKSINLGKGDLDKDYFKVKGHPKSSDLSEPINRIKTGTDHIDTNEIKKIKRLPNVNSPLDTAKEKLKDTFYDAAKRGDDVTMGKLAQIAKKLGGKGLKALPLVGSIGAAALGGAEDASAAIPLLDQADSVGMSAEDENIMLSETDAKIDYAKSKAAKDRAAALAKLAKSLE